MPPRARRYDEVIVRRATTVQWQLLSRVLDDVRPEQYARPTRLGDWTVAGLVTHLGETVAAVSRSVAGAAPGSPTVLLSTYLTGTAARAEAVQRAVAAAGRRDPVRVREVFDGQLRDARAAVRSLGNAAAATTVAVRQGRLGLVDYLVSRLVETVVHLTDLHAALPEVALPPRILAPDGARTGGTGDVDPDAAQLVVRALADTLAHQVPGRTCEVRVTDARLRVGVAVQCLEGPRHTRGTPPNVVEVDDALLFAELATGRVPFATAVADGRVRASGERSDLTAYLPVLR